MIVCPGVRRAAAGSILALVLSPALSRANGDAAAGTGALRLSGGAEDVVTRSKAVFATDGPGELPKIELVWQGLILKRGRLEAGVPVDLSLELVPAFGAKAGGVLVTALESITGELRVRAAHGPTTWTVSAGNFGSQSARTNFDTAAGTLHLVLPLLLHDGKGTTAGVMIAAVCSRGQEQWSCNRASVVFEEMRRQAQPTASIDDIVGFVEPAGGANRSGGQ